MSSSEESDRCEEFAVSSDNVEQELFTQAELNDLVRADLDLPKFSAKLLKSPLKEKNMLAPETKISFYRYRKKSS